MSDFEAESIGLRGRWPSQSALCASTRANHTWTRPAVASFLKGNRSPKTQGGSLKESRNMREIANEEHRYTTIAKTNELLPRGIARENSEFVEEVPRRCENREMSRIPPAEISDAPYPPPDSQTVCKREITKITGERPSCFRSARPPNPFFFGKLEWELMYDLAIIEGQWLRIGSGEVEPGAVE
ncbi:hypothetical protein B0H16DRAFT_1462966 [Mycena metata]|uniref:Uncharacterized protein n=1 Tax=Mycena metata TaxID=1033252 RepID=A0AAD7N4G3_9AGAR|nr:hypothetical protein B0H16DRAFT_1462966 [Mycena metata]